MKFLVRYQATINIIDQKNDQIYQKLMKLYPFQIAILCLAASAAASGHYGHHGYAVGYAYPLGYYYHYNYLNRPHNCRFIRLI